MAYLALSLHWVYPNSIIESEVPDMSFLLKKRAVLKRMEVFSFHIRIPEINSFPSSVPLYWLISDLIPKKSEKFEFRKIFLTIFFSVKNWPRKTKFWLFSPTQFSKKCKIIFKICSWDNYLKNGKFWKNLFFFEISVKFWVHGTHSKKFSVHESKVMKHFLFLEHYRFQSLWYTVTRYIGIFRIRILRRIQKKSKFLNPPTQIFKTWFSRKCVGKNIFLTSNSESA